MDPLTVFTILIACYCVLLFFDIFLKSCAHYPYLRLLEGFGLRISYLSIQWKTKAFNRLIIKWGTTRPQFWKVWFKVGTFTTLAFIPFTIIVLFINIKDIFFINNTGNYEPLITPIIPGVNLPISEIGYYCLSLLICSVVHEIGHALAAVMEDICSLEVGCTLYFILPVAYVNLPTDKFMQLSPKKRLKVFCAGVWHNIYLSFLAYLIYCCLPTCFSPFFEYGKSVSVVEVSKLSPLNDPIKGLYVNEVVYKINDCIVKNEEDWYNCLNNKESLKPGVCIKSDLINTLDESIPLKHLGSGFVECCDSKNNKNICFEFIDTQNREIQLPEHVCLPGRIVLEQSSNFCAVNPHHCPDDMYCFKPILPNNTYLFKIVTDTKNVIYLGHPNDLFQTMEVSSYVNKNNVINVKFPNRVSKLLKYIVVISLGLAFINILPFIFMDGEYILQSLALILLKSHIDKRSILRLVNVVTWLTSALLLLYLSYSVIRII